MTDATAIQVSYEPFARDTAPAFVQEGAAVRFARSAAYRIHLPDGVGLVAARTGGDLRVQGVTGDIDLGTVRGDLRLDSLAGRVTVGEANGDVRAEGVADLRLTGVCHGDLRFEAGGALTLGSLSGDLRLSAATEVRLGRIHGDMWAEKVADGLELTAPTAMHAWMISAPRSRWARWPAICGPPSWPGACPRPG